MSSDYSPNKLPHSLAKSVSPPLGRAFVQPKATPSNSKVAKHQLPRKTEEHSRQIHQQSQQRTSVSSLDQTTSLNGKSIIDCICIHSPLNAFRLQRKKLHLYRTHHRQYHTIVSRGRKASATHPIARHSSTVTIHWTVRMRVRVLVVVHHHREYVLESLSYV